MVGRRLFVLVLLGLLVGAGLGVGFTVWRKHAYPVPGYGYLGQKALPGLSASCSGGTIPVALISWTKELDGFNPGLERSVNGGPFRTLGAPTVTSGQPHAVDTDVQPNTKYQYRIMNGGTLASGVVEITTDLLSCSSQ